MSVHQDIEQVIDRFENFLFKKREHLIKLEEGLEDKSNLKCVGRQQILILEILIEFREKFYPDEK